MKGKYVHDASSSLELLSTKISQAIQTEGAKGMYLDDWIGVVDRKHLRHIVDGMRRKSKGERSPFYESYVTLLKDRKNEWFATFHVSPRS
jgi:hypothetical protein